MPRYARIIGIIPIKIAGLLLPHLVFKLSVNDAIGTSIIPSIILAITTIILHTAAITKFSLPKVHTPISSWLNPPVSNALQIYEPIIKFNIFTPIPEHP